MHRNFVRDAMYGILHHCEHQNDSNTFRSNTRHPMAQTGQVPDALVEVVVSIGFRLLEAALAENNYNQPQVNNEADVLTAATNAYQKGHITKAQYFAVINALDETTTVETTATTQPSWNEEYIAANRYLNGIRNSKDYKQIRR